MPVSSSHPTSATSDQDLKLPLARINKIAKLDPEVKKFTREALLLITKSAELFTEKLGRQSEGVAKVQNRRTLLPEDVMEVCSGGKEQFLFLREDIRDLVREQIQERNNNKKEKNVVADLGNQQITAFFGRGAQ
mmetsp:Transcript_26868/g.32552  ORF Transcript_26868/g.32552 Transcript_26868/m.32552 type:complete len:134 (-) Transcript_26868:54-455(-)